ncbi:MAG: TniQ family protein [Acidobacteria bacterium]|nr:TniQ family protein [Acidobacteriota bacterium]
MEACTEADSSEIWPIHFQPKSDELLSSWVMRLAIAYSMNYLTFIQTIAASAYPAVTNFRTDWDCFAPRQALHYLSRVTTTPFQSIERATLLQQAEASVLSPYWFLSASAIQYCPLCLSEDQYPYFRREWRFAFITCCETHESFLADSCPQCGTSISCKQSRKEQENGDVYLALRYCHRCQSDLGNKQTTHLPSISELEFHQHLRHAIRQGGVDLPAGYRVASHRYFAGIQTVTHRLTIGKSGQVLQQALLSNIESNKLSQVEAPIVSCQINRLNLNQRRVILHLLWKLIQTWPATGAKCANSAKGYDKLLFREEQRLNIELCRIFLIDESDDTEHFV